MKISNGQSRFKRNVVNATYSSCTAVLTPELSNTFDLTKHMNACLLLGACVCLNVQAFLVLALTQCDVFVDYIVEGFLLQWQALTLLEFHFVEVFDG